MEERQHKEFVEIGSRASLRLLANSAINVNEIILNGKINKIKK